MRTESFPGVNITPNPKLLSRYPWLREESVVRSLLTRAWDLPILESGAYLPGMGTTGHGASPTALHIDGIPKPVHIFSKPAERELARREFINGFIARRRGINTPLSLALVEIDGDDFSLVLGNLMHDVEPLSLRNLDFGRADPRVYSPREMLEDFVGFIAKFNSKGIAQGDLHTGNIGYKYRKDKPPTKVLFDLESALVLSDYELAVFRNEGYVQDTLHEKFTMFENMAATDLGTFLAYLTDQHFPMDKDELLGMATVIYFQRRRPMPSEIFNGAFNRRLRNDYERVLKKLQRIDSDHLNQAC